MNIERTNQWLNLAANLGVLVGIVFLVIEINQNTTAVNSNTILELSNGTTNSLYSISENLEIATLIAVGDEMPNSLEEPDRLRYYTWNQAQWIRFQNIFYQYKLNSLPDDMWNSYYVVMCANNGSPGPKQVFEGMSGVLIPEFIEIIESC